MIDKTFVLKENNEAIRKKITEAGIYVCHCASFKLSCWLDYSTVVGNGVHGVGYPFEGETQEQTLAMFKHELKNPVWCKDVDEFIKLILEFLNGKDVSNTY